MTTDVLKVGDLARRSGVTVRTLHWYEEIGLLVPSHRTESGHRLYGPADLERLHRIRSLQAIGFSLEEVRTCLDRPEYSMRRIVQMHMERLDAEIEGQRRLRERLGAIARSLDAGGRPSVHELTETLIMMERIERHYTAEQLEKLRERGREIGEERILQVQDEWRDLIALVRTEMEKGSDHASPAVQALAKRWMGLVREFTGGDPGITKSVAQVYRSEPDLHARYDCVPTPEMMEFMTKAIGQENLLRK